MAQFIKKYYWLLLGLLFLVFRLPTLFEPNWYGDEGIYLALGQAVRHGWQLYTQVHDNKPPTLYLLAAISQTVFGFRLLLLVVMIPTLYYFYRLALNLLTPTAAKIALFFFLILTSIPFVEGTIANAEIFMLLPTIFGVLVFLESKSRFRYLLSGLLLGVAFTIKVPVFVEMAFLGLWLLIQPLAWSKKIINAFSFALGCLLPIGLYALYYLTQGNIGDFIFAALLQNFGYLASWSTGTQHSSFLQGGLFTRALVLFSVWALLFILHLKKFFKDKYIFLFFWFAATIFASLLSARPYPHYLIQVLPPLSLLFGLLFLPKLKSTKIMTTAAILIFFALVAKYKFYFYPIVSYYYNFYSYTLHTRTQSQYDNFFGYRVETDQRIADYIKLHSVPTDRIFVWGDEPYIYPQSGRLSSGRFLVAYHIVDFNRYQETMDHLKADFPKFIITFPMNGRPFPELKDFISTYYFPDQVFDGNIVVYQHR